MSADLSQRLTQSVEAFQRALDEHAGALSALRAVLRRDGEQRARQAQARLMGALGRLPPPATAPWDDARVWGTPLGAAPAWMAAATLEPVAVRVGALHAAGGTARLPDVPAMFDVLGSGHLAIVESAGGAAQPRPEQVQGLVLRVLASAQPGSVELWFADARSAGAIHAPFASLLAAGARTPADAVAIDERTVDALLSRLTAHMLNVQSTVLKGQFRTLSDLYASTGRASVPRRLLVINGFPRGFMRDSARSLETILRNGAASGVHVLMTVDPSVPVPDDVDLPGMLAATTALSPSSAGGGWSTPVLPGCTVALDAPPRQQVLLDAVGHLAAGAHATAAASVPLDPTIPPPAGMWRESSAQSLSTVIGYDATGDEVWWEVSDRGSTWATFVAGTAGSGKSNLLHTLIAGLAARYDDEELEMYLLDFKQGVEMWQYGPVASPQWLPHVRVVARSTDRELGIDVLVRLNAELDRRYAAYTRMGLSENTYTSYRAGGGKLPRTLVILDEFQDLLLPADAVGDRAIEQLTRLAKLGRAGGFHLVLATQTLNGLGEVANKLKGILDQHEVRIALKLDPEMSRDVLAGHPDAAHLTKRGQAIVQRGIGSASFKRVDVLHAEGATLRRVRAQAAARRRPHRTPPVAFDGDARPSLDDLAVLEPILGTVVVGADALDGVAGRPVSMDPPLRIQLRADPGSHVVLGGAGREMANGVLQTIALSLAAHAAPGRLQVLLVDPVPGRSAIVEPLKVGLPALGANVVHITRGELLRRYLDRLGRMPATGRPQQRTVVLGVDMDVFPTMGVDGDDLAKVLQQGPMRGIHGLLWFGNLSGPNDLFGYGFLEANLHQRILLGAARDELLSSGFLPVMAPERPPGKTRADLWTRDTPTAVTRFIPPDPLDAGATKRWLVSHRVSTLRPAGTVS